MSQRVIYPITVHVAYTRAVDGDRDLNWCVRAIATGNSGFGTLVAAFDDRADAVRFASDLADRNRWSLVTTKKGEPDAAHHPA